MPCHQQTDQRQKKTLSTSGSSDPDAAAHEAVCAAAVDPASFVFEEAPAPTNPSSAEPVAAADAAADLPNGLQKKLTRLVHKQTATLLYAKLGEQQRATGHSSIPTAGEVVLARLRSQSGQFAMACLTPQTNH
jgi:hypothetical protein